jgi:hypothetical protein
MTTAATVTNGVRSAGGMSLTAAATITFTAASFDRVAEAAGELHRGVQARAREHEADRDLRPDPGATAGGPGRRHSFGDGQGLLRTNPRASLTGCSVPARRAR